ncbi:hypothetical protein CXB51_000338 [Gossypium anomalum]|uniref:DUF7745 domain-containing protein n=1 Tax=Gossypium anomalum TaxID=47600 RepID=A0A8J6DB73_9ROSI|nr:hypothetical protein CXB51_000338 [Gossypium anomalum]
MEKGFLDRVEDNAAVRVWSEKTRQEKGDSLAEGYESELWDFTRISVTQNDLRELREIWNSWNDEIKQLFYCNYGDLPCLLDITVDKYLFRALAQFWNPAYSCFTFGGVDLVPTVEEYMALLNCPSIQADRAYSRPVSVPPFSKKLVRITGMSEQWVAARIKQKGDSKCIPWGNLRDLILAHPDLKKRVDVFALSIYGLVVFPKALGYVDEAVSDLFDQLDKGTTPVPAILAETFRSSNACRRAGEGRFIGCAQLLLAWFHSHFWKAEKVSYRVFSRDYSPLRELVATSRRDDISEEKWITIFQNLQAENIEWRAPWFLSGEILYRCGNFDWVPLAGIWGASGYTPLLVLRQYRSRQFILATQGLAQCEFSYKDDGYKKKVREISDAWNQTRRMKGFTAGPMTTPEYEWWRGRRVNDNIPKPNQGSTQPIEEHLRVAPSELEIIKQDFERKSSEFGKKIEQLEEEKMRLGLDVDIHKLEAEKLRKGKNKAEEELDSLKTDYKKLRKSIRTAGLGKTSEQWRQEIGKEKTRADQWEKKFHDVRVQEDVLKKNLLESQNEKEKLRSRVAELERSLHQHRSRNSVIELKASLSRIEELKEEIGKLETALQDSKIRVELLEANNEQYREQLFQSQDQIRNRDYVMGEAVTQVREVADHLQTLAVQADILSLKYESESDRGRNLAWLLRKVKALGIRAKSYM